MIVPRRQENPAACFLYLDLVPIKEVFKLFHGVENMIDAPADSCAVEIPGFQRQHRHAVQPWTLLRVDVHPVEVFNEIAGLAAVISSHVVILTFFIGLRAVICTVKLQFIFYLLL